jgi:hypothetical protein
MMVRREGQPLSAKERSGNTFTPPTGHRLRDRLMFRSSTRLGCVPLDSSWRGEGGRAMGRHIQHRRLRFCKRSSLQLQQNSENTCLQLPYFATGQFARVVTLCGMVSRAQTAPNAHIRTICNANSSLHVVC